MFETILVLNAIWFALAFHVFAIRNQVFAKILVPKEHRNNPAFDVLVASGKFLGGFNLAFMLLNVLLLFNLDTFPTDQQRTILLLVFAVAHGSQFFFNLPIALQNRQDGGVWQVLKGLMLFIFVTDCVMMFLNLGWALWLYF